MAQRFTWSIKDILWLTTLLAVLLGWIISDLERQREPRAILRQWSIERAKHNAQWQQAQTENVENLILKKETKELKEEIKSLKQGMEQMRKLVDK